MSLFFTTNSKYQLLQNSAFTRKHRKISSPRAVKAGNVDTTSKVMITAKSNGHISGFSDQFSGMKMKVKSDSKNGFLLGLRKMLGWSADHSQMKRRSRGDKLVPLWFWLMTSFLVTISTVNCQGEHEPLFHSLSYSIFIFQFRFGFAIFSKEAQLNKGLVSVFVVKGYFLVRSLIVSFRLCK